MRLLSLDVRDRWESPPADLRALADYLAGGVVLRRVRSFSIDEIHPVRGRVVGSSVLTDGDWVWSAGHAHYVRTYAVRLPDEFVDHVRLAGHRVAAVGDTRLRELTLQARTLGVF